MRRSAGRWLKRGIDLLSNKTDPLFGTVDLIELTVSKNFSAFAYQYDRSHPLGEKVTQKPHSECVAAIWGGCLVQSVLVQGYAQKSIPGDLPSIGRGDWQKSPGWLKRYCFFCRRAQPAAAMLRSSQGNQSRRQLPNPRCLCLIPRRRWPQLPLYCQAANLVRFHDALL